MIRSTVAFLLLAACGAPEPAEPTPSSATEGVEPGPEARPPDTEPDPPPAPPSQDRPSIRVALENPTIPAGADPSTDENARLDAILYARNEGSAPVTLETAIPAAFELEWRLTAADGTVWRPTFLPPPVPRPGGAPRTTVTVPAGGEAEVARLHGISGFHRESADASTRGPLPAGTYEVVVSGIRLGEDAPPRTAPPVALTVR